MGLVRGGKGGENRGVGRMNGVDGNGCGRQGGLTRVGSAEDSREREDGGLDGVAGR